MRSDKSRTSETPRNRFEGEHARSEVMGQQVNRGGGNPIGTFASPYFRGIILLLQFDS